MERIMDCFPRIWLAACAALAFAPGAARSMEVGTHTAPGVSFTMPVADDGAPLVRSADRDEAPPPRGMVDDALLRRLKEESTEPGEPPVAVGLRAQGDSEPDPAAVAVNCTTNVAAGNAPSDVHGAVGPTRLVVVTNSHIGAYDKTTCAGSQVSFATFFAPVGTAGQSLFDPRVVWDGATARFAVTVESRNTVNSDQYQYLAVSQDSTATSWWLYRIRLSEGATTFCKRAPGTFWDYPNLGSDAARWYIAGTDFGNGAVGSNAGAVMSIEKAPSLTGGVVRIRCFTSISATHLAPPIVQDGATTAYFLAPSTGIGSSIRRFALTPSQDQGGFPANLTDTFSETPAISVSSYGMPPDAEQPNGQRLDTIDARFQSATIQLGTSLWNVHTIASNGRARARVYRFSTTGTSPLFTLFPTTAGGADNLFNPSVATNGTTVFVTLTRTIPSDPVSGRAAMLILSGPPETVTGWVYDLVATSAAQSEFVGTAQEPTTPCNDSTRGSCRWGDYSSTQVDPDNSSRAWGFNQLVTGPSIFDWSTRAARVGGGGTATATATHDFDASGRSDIAWRDGAGNVAVWLMNGSTITTGAGLGNIPTAWQIVGQRDFNGDGRHDLLWRDGTGNVAMWFMNGTAVSGSTGVATVPTAWAIAGTGDFNADGRGDILWRHGNGDVAVWLMNGGAILGGAGLGNVATAWRIVGTADFNGDGRADILWRDAAGSIALWFMNGAAIASGAGVGAVPTAWQIRATGDFDGNGRADILWRDGAGNIAAWLMNGASIASAAGLGAVPPNWTIVGTGDFGGDGRSDILWRDSAGTVAMWFMNGLTVASGANLGAVPLTWTIQNLNAN